MRPYLALVGGVHFPAQTAKAVECEASTVPLVNLTRVSTAAHSTQYFDF